MTSGWNACALGDVIEKTETTDPTRNPDKGFSYIDVSSVNNKTLSIETVSKLKGSEAPSRARKRVRTNDVIFATVRPTLKRIALIPEQYDQQVCSTGYFVLRGKQFIDNRFLFYFLQTDEVFATVEKLQKGASYPAITDSDVKSLRFSYPPIEEQRRIVAILDEAFACIDKAKANTENNIRNARELFDSYLNNIFSNPGPDWEEKVFDEFCEIPSMLVDPRLSEYQDLTHVGAANIEIKTGELSDLKTAKEERLKSGKFWFDGTMVLYSKIRPYLMKVARPDFVGLCSADIYPLASKNGSISRDFLFYLLLAPDFTDYAISGSARAGMPKVNREHLFAYRCYLPPIKVQQEIAKKFDELSCASSALESTFDEKLAHLSEVKKSILQKAFSGEITKNNGQAVTE